MTRFCPDYGSIAHAGLQVHGYLYQKGDFVATRVTQAVQKSYPKKSEYRDQTAKYKSHGFFPVHFSVEMREDTFS